MTKSNKNMRKKFILMLAVACTLQMKAGVLSTCMDSTKIETKYCTKSLPFGSPSNEDAVAIGSLWSGNWFVGVSGGTNAVQYLPFHVLINGEMSRVHDLDAAIKPL